MTGLARTLRLGLCLLIATAAIIGATHLSLRQPWIGVGLRYDDKACVMAVKTAKGPAAGLPKGTRIRSIGDGRDTIMFDERDLAAWAPHESAQAFSTYLDRQQKLSEVIGSGAVVFVDDKAESHGMTLGEKRPLTSLPLGYWAQLLAGVVVWLAAGWVWAFRRETPGRRYLLLAGLGGLAFAGASAVMAARELALPRDLFLGLDITAFLGAGLFVGAAAATLLYAPRRVAPAWLGPIVVILVISGGIAALVSGASGPVRLSPILVSIVLALALAVIQRPFSHREKVSPEG